MKQELKTRWIAALRGGEYQQGKGRLRREESMGDSFCCLGVLCDLVSKDGWHRTDNGSWKFVFGNDFGIGFLPVPFRQAVDLPQKVTDQCINLNDNGDTFPVIADYLEANLETNP